MATTPLAPEVAGLAKGFPVPAAGFNLLGPYDETPVFWGVAPAAIATEQSSAPGYVPIVDRSPLDSGLSFEFGIIVLDMQPSLIVNQSPVFQDIDYTVLPVGTGVLYTDPVNPCGSTGGGGSERPDDGLLYPRGQG